MEARKKAGWEVTVVVQGKDYSAGSKEMREVKAISKFKYQICLSSIK